MYAYTIWLTSHPDHFSDNQLCHDRPEKECGSDAVNQTEEYHEEKHKSFQKNKFHRISLVLDDIGESMNAQLMDTLNAKNNNSSQQEL
ncbi:MAG: hypothetical protein HGB01_02640 [Chlorobiaceae bacterium]|nr:hypothetical protein [Chlorobiaceae bacterium]